MTDVISLIFLVFYRIFPGMPSSHPAFVLFPNTFPSIRYVHPQKYSCNSKLYIANVAFRPALRQSLKPKLSGSNFGNGFLLNKSKEFKVNYNCQNLKPVGLSDLTASTALDDVPHT